MSAEKSKLTVGVLMRSAPPTSNQSRSLVGSVKLGRAKVDGVMVTMRRDTYGHDNVSDILERLQADKQAAIPDETPSTLSQCRVAQEFWTFDASAKQLATDDMIQILGVARNRPRVM